MRRLLRVCADVKRDNVMNEHEMIWRILGLVTRDHEASTLLAKAVLKWVRENKKALHLDTEPGAKRLSWRGLSARSVRRQDMERNGAPELLALAGMVATAVQLDDFNTRLMRVLVGADRLPLVTGLANLLRDQKADMLALFGEISGAQPREAARRVRQSELVRLGLARLFTTRTGLVGFEPSWTLERVLDRGLADEDAIVEALVGRHQRPALDCQAFEHVEEPAGLVVRLLKGAMRERAPGINILFYGPPGTGKTELARTLSHAAGARLYSVGEADEEGQEPNRWDRVTAYKLAQRVIERRSHTVLLFDEMEDLIGAARPTDDDYFTSRDGSKVFINRLLETNPAPTIWTTNAIGNVDPAILRRMSYILKLDYPSARAGRAILGRVAGDEQVTIRGSALGHLIDHAPETSTVLRTALRAGRLAQGGEADALRSATSLVGAMRGAARLRLPERDPARIDLGLYEAAQDLEALLADLSDAGAPRDFSLLLTGPPGTGKTALAHHLAYRLERPLIVKRASDLLSKWVGETEQQIARAFEEAIAKDGVLLFDEVDSLLADRSGARNSWEVTQVNELLTWCDSHPLPFIAATNFGARLDPAALRRFVFKVDLKPLSVKKAEAAYARFFGMPAPANLRQLNGLTPGDLAVVARQLRYLKERPEPAMIVARLAAELAAKPEGGGRIGF